MSLDNTAGFTMVLDLDGFSNNVAALNGGGINGGNVELDAATLTLDSASATTQTYAGVISGTGGLVKAGDAGFIQVLTGTNLYIGGTTITSGTLQLGNGGTTGSILGKVVDNGTLAFNRSDAVTFGGVISGTGAVQQIGTGTTILTGANTYNGGTTISAGTLQLGNGGATGSIVGNVTNNGTLAFNRSDVVAFGGVISGTGAVQHLGTGTTILAADNTYTGVTTISAGTLQLGNAGTTGSIVGDVLNNSLLAFNRTDTFTLGGLISGTGAVLQDGAGTTILTGDNSYLGATDVTTGTLLIDGDQSAATGLTTVFTGATLAGSGIVGGTYSCRAGRSHRAAVPAR
jgi:fibronectin-binding autotransporter adhesin